MTGTRSRTRCTGSALGQARMTVQTAQHAHRSRQTNQRLIHPWMGVIAILEELQLIQGVMTVETILGDAWDARLVECRTAGSAALTTLWTFHAEHFEINHILPKKK